MTDMAWYLDGSDQTVHKLPNEMLFVGRQDCELILKCKSVDKQHAVLNYDLIQQAFRIKDLGSLNGTFVNETRLPEQIYITMKEGDVIQFGYDTNTFTISKKRIFNGKDIDGLLKKTKKKTSSTTTTSLSSDSTERAVPSIKPKLPEQYYFEIPTKDSKFIRRNKTDDELDKIPTKDTNSQGSASPRTNSYTVDIKGNQKVVNGVNNLQHYASLRKSKQQINSQELIETSNSVDKWFAANQPSKASHNSPIKQTKQVDNKGIKQSRSRESISSSRKASSLAPKPSDSPQKSKQTRSGNSSRTQSSRLSMDSKPPIKTSSSKLSHKMNNDKGEKCKSETKKVKKSSSS
uniref:FHA domain-containing protein n=1 Tax=Ciona savignyi TaxID=51511 RepID=H2Z4R9_CIOSA